MSGDEPEGAGEPTLPESTWARVRAGMSSDDGVPMPPGVVEAFGRGLATIFGQPRKLLTVGVLLLVLLVPVQPVVTVDMGVWLSTFVVVALLPVTYVRRDDATARVSLLWLAGVATLCALLATPWIGVVLSLLLVPYTAIPVAAWASGSWRIGARAVARMFRDTWLSTIAMSLGVGWLFGLVLGVAFLVWGAEMPVGIGHLLIVAFVFVATSLGIGYALVALERGRAISPP